jgi:uncharacterized protein (DUF58 family)
LPVYGFSQDSDCYADGMTLLTPEQRKLIRRLHLQARRLARSSLSGNYASAFHGAGLRFEEVRPYSTGDDIRQIDWNVTARMNEPFIKSFREERERSVWFLLDVSASVSIPRQPRSVRQVLSEIAAVLASVAMLQGDRVGLILASSSLDLVLHPKEGIHSQLRLLQELLYHQGKAGKTDWNQLLPRVHRLISQRGVLFWLSDFLDLGFDTALKPLATRQEVIAIQTIDPIMHSIEERAIIRFQDAESRQIRLIDFRKEASRKAALDRWQTHQNQLRSTFVRHEIPHLQLDLGGKHLEALPGFLAEIAAGRRR